MLRHLVGATVVFSTTFSVSCKTRDPSSVPESTLASSEQNEGKSFPQAFSYIVVEPGRDSSGSSLSYHIDAESPVELWCETSCSKFSLVDSKEGDAYVVQAIRIPQKNNTQPSQLKVEKKKIVGTKEDLKKIILKNVGKKGDDVVLQEEISDRYPNFYAVMGVLKPAMAIGGESPGYQITFAGKTMDAAVSDGAIISQIQSKPEGLKGFVRGSVVQKEGTERGTYSVFLVRSIDTKARF